MANSISKTKKRRDIIKLIIKLILDMIPLILTTIIAISYNKRITYLIYKECVENGSLLWMGCIYIVISLVELYSAKKKHKLYAGVLYILFIPLLLVNYAFYILLKASTLTTAEPMCMLNINIVVWTGYLGALVCYILSSIEPYI